MQTNNTTNKKDSINERQEQIRNYFLKKTISPKYFCSYLKFAQVFPSPNIYEAYTSENLNIIDTHLRYHNNAFYEMAPYKWIPIIGIALITKLSTFSMVFPLIYTNLYDTYFKKYFIWKHRNDKIINIQREFVTKLSKRKNKVRRVTLFGKINEELGITEGQLESGTSPGAMFLSSFVPQTYSLANIPQKYIKFGESTPYIFHATTEQLNMLVEESHMFVTPLFELYNKVTSNLLQSVKQMFKNLKNLKKNYSQFRQDYKANKELYDKYLFIDTQHLLKFKDVKKDLIYSETKRAEYRIRRFLELLHYHTTGQFLMNGFLITDWTHLYRHLDLLQPQIFNSETNKADLGLFYAAVALPKFFKFLLRRKVSM